MTGAIIVLVVIAVLFAVLICYAAARQRRHPPSGDWVEPHENLNSQTYDQDIRNMRDGRR